MKSETKNKHCRKKNLFTYFKCRFSLYMPESFKLFFCGKPVILSDAEKSEFILVLMKQQQEEYTKHLKRFVRKKTRFSISQNDSWLLTYPDKEYKSWAYLDERVGRYDIASKLRVYKKLKKMIVDDESQFEIKQGEIIPKKSLYVSKKASKTVKNSRLLSKHIRLIKR